MLKFPRAGGPSFFSALRDDTRKVADMAGVPQNTAEMIKAGFKVSIKVFACVIAAHELQTHAGRLLGEASGEIVTREREADDAVKNEHFEIGHQSGTAGGFASGRLLGWVEACGAYGAPVPPWVVYEIRRRQKENVWPGPPIAFESSHPEPDEGDVDEGQAVDDAEVVDEVPPGAKHTPFEVCDCRPDVHPYHCAAEANYVARNRDAG